MARSEALPPLLTELKIEGLRAIDETGDTWLGWADLFGATFHVELVRVVENSARRQDTRPEAGELAGLKYEAMQAYYDGVYQTAEIPGIEGRYAMFIVPYCD